MASFYRIAQTNKYCRGISDTAEFHFPTKNGNGIPLAVAHASLYGRWADDPWWDSVLTYVHSYKRYKNWQEIPGTPDQAYGSLKIKDCEMIIFGLEALDSDAQAHASFMVFEWR